MEICRRASKDQHAVHLREFADTYVRVELHHQAGMAAREIQADLIDSGQAAGVHPLICSLRPRPSATVSPC
jgi:hypothetical protein